MTEYRKLALLAIRAQSVAVIALTDALLSEENTETEQIDDCLHANRMEYKPIVDGVVVTSGKKLFHCLDCKLIVPCPHDRTQDASTMGHLRRFCPDCERIFEGDALNEIPE